VSKEPSKVIENILKQLKNKDNKLLLNASNACNKILYLILDGLFKSYFESIIYLEKKVEVFEEEILKNNTKQFVRQFIDIRRQILRIIRYITPIVYLIDIIKLNENNSISKDMMRYFENIEIKFDKLGSNITSLRESVAYLREAYEAEVSNQANYIMKTFTIVSGVFLPLTLLTGIFGMNFQEIPLLSNRFGFYYLMVFMIILSIYLIYLFRCRKWM
jgi:magnesium transporter